MPFRRFAFGSMCCHPVSLEFSLCVHPLFPHRIPHSIWSWVWHSSSLTEYWRCIGHSHLWSATPLDLLSWPFFAQSCWGLQTATEIEWYLLLWWYCTKNIYIKAFFFSYNVDFIFGDQVGGWSYLLFLFCRACPLIAYQCLFFLSFLKIKWRIFIYLGKSSVWGNSGFCCQRQRFILFLVQWICK